MKPSILMDLQNDKTSHACLIICCTQNMHLPVCPQLPAPHITEAAPILLDVIINQRRVTTSDIIHNRGSHLSCRLSPQLYYIYDGAAGLANKAGNEGSRRFQDTINSLCTMLINRCLNTVNRCRHRDHKTHRQFC